MKTSGRPRSKNIVDKRSFPMNGVDEFLAESLRLASKNYKVPLPRKRPKNNGKK